MALMQCPECGHEVSDKAGNCPHCGCPISLSVPESQPVHITDIRIPGFSLKARKKVISIIIASLCSLVVVVVLVLGINHKIASDRYDTYLDDLKQIRITMLRGAADSETLCNLTRSVWSDTIYKEFDVDTYKYTMTNGVFDDDFNTSLSALYSDSNTKNSISKIKENQEEVSSIMSRLQDPPESLKSCYETVSLMYDAYTTFTNFAISPSGSLTTYSSRFIEYDDDFSKYYDHLVMQLEPLVETESESG